MSFITAPAGWKLASWPTLTRTPEIHPLLGWKHEKKVPDGRLDTGTPVYLKGIRSEVYDPVQHIRYFRAKVVMPEEDFDLAKWGREVQAAWDAEVEREKAKLLGMLEADGVARFRVGEDEVLLREEAAYELVDAGLALLEQKGELVSGGDFIFGPHEKGVLRPGKQ